MRKWIISILSVVLAFCLTACNVHNGSRFSGTIETIQALESEATVITDGFTVNERDVPDAAGDVADWLEGIGY